MEELIQKNLHNEYQPWRVNILLGGALKITISKTSDFLKKYETCDINKRKGNDISSPVTKSTFNSLMSVYLHNSIYLLILPEHQQPNH